MIFNYNAEKDKFKSILFAKQDFVVCTVSCWNLWKIKCHAQGAFLRKYGMWPRKKTRGFCSIDQGPLEYLYIFSRLYIYNYILRCRISENMLKQYDIISYSLGYCWTHLKTIFQLVVLWNILILFSYSAVDAFLFQIWFFSGRNAMLCHF